MPDDVFVPVMKSTITNHRKAIRYISGSSIATITFKPLLRPRKQITITLINISSRGARILSKYKFPNNTKIIFNLTIQESLTWKVPAKILSQYNNAEYGISFDNIQHDLIDEIMKNEVDFTIA